jgi:rhamnulose-1-phosphate aldolase
MIWNMLKNDFMSDDRSANAEIKDVLEEIAEVAGFLWQKGWAERNAGNISMNISDISHQYLKSNNFDLPVKLNPTFSNLANQFILVTGTGTRMRDVFKNPDKHCCIISLDSEGCHYRILSKNDAGTGLKPTSELPTHLAIHDMLAANKRPERVVVHTHPDNLIALTHIEEFCDENRINKRLWSIQPETCLFVHDGLGFVNYLMTGTDELAQATIRALQNHRVVLWEKHGCLAIGKTAGEAFDLIDILDKSTSIFFTCKKAGYHVDGIKKTDLDELRRAFGIAGK